MRNLVRRLLGIFLPPEGWRRRRAIRQGCGPFTLVFVLMVAMFAAILTVLNVPSFESDPLAYRLESSLTVLLLIILACSVLGVWMMGLFAARAGAHTVQGQGQWLLARMRIVWRRLALTVAVLIAMRLLVLLLAAAALTFIITSVADFGFSTDFVTYFQRAGVGVHIVAVGVVTVHLLVGPVLRLFYSTAVGAFGATFAHSPDSKVSAGLTARAAAGMVGIVTVVWGLTLVMLTALTINQPHVSFSPRFFGNDTWPVSQDAIQHFIQMVIIITSFLPFHMALQAIGGTIFLALTRRRLARREPSQPEPGWLQRIEKQLKGI